jgi:hypothetical protein
MRPVPRPIRCTAGAGALLSLLRERSGSLAAPVLLHLAANCAAPLASTLARPAGERPQRDDDPGQPLPAGTARHDLAPVRLVWLHRAWIVTARR